MSAATREPDPSMLVIRRALRLLHDADAALFMDQARGIAYALEGLATKDVDSQVAADARRLADRLFLLYPLEASASQGRPRRRI